MHTWGDRSLEEAVGEPMGKNLDLEGIILNCDWIVPSEGGGGWEVDSAQPRL